ncbi:hypothetical protein D3C77_728460 [compost metagenome]
MLAAQHVRCGKTRTEFDAFNSADGEHGLGQLGIQLVEHRLAQPGLYAANPAFDDAAAAVPRGCKLFDPLNHPHSSIGIAGPHRILLNDFFVKGFTADSA